MKALILSALFFIISFSAHSRSPSIPGNIDFFAEDVSYYVDNKERDGFNRMEFIPVFENLFNTEAIEDEKLKQNVFCILLEFYRESDPEFAKEFMDEMPRVSCE